MGGVSIDIPRVRGWLRSGNGAVMGLLCRCAVKGLHHVPTEGPFLLVFNHTSNFDPSLLYSAVPRGDLVGLVAASYRSRPLTRRVIEASGSIWLRRGAGDRTALKQALELLSLGVPVGMSPEGGRSATGQLRSARPGVAFLAHRAGVPLLPVGIIGADRLAASIHRLRRSSIQIRFGRTFHLPGLDLTSPRRSQLRAHANLILKRVADLLPREYRGVYGGTAVAHEDAA